MSINVGIVGCGSIAAAHVRAYAQIPEVRITQVFDINQAAASRMAEQYGALVARSVDAMVAGGDLHAVSICTPPAVHEAQCLPFIRTGVAILCEKPLAAELDSARRIHRAVLDRQALFMLGFCHRFHGPVVQLKRLIDAGTLGTPLLMRNLFGGYLPLATNHRSDPALSGGGALMDNASHSIDLFRHLVGEPTDVTAMTANVTQDIAVEDFGMLQLGVDGKQFGEITASYSLPAAVNSIELYASRGMAIVTYWETDAELKYRLKDDLQWQVVDCSVMPDRFTAQIEHFVDCVRHNRRPKVGAEDGLRAAELIAAAYSAADQTQSKESCARKITIASSI